VYPQFGPPASDADLLGARQELAFLLGPQPLPEALASFWRRSNGALGNDFLLYSTAEIAERNQTYEVHVYLPGYLNVGDDGGGKAALVKLGEADPEVFLNGRGGTLESMEPLGLALGAWLAGGCPFGTAAAEPGLADCVRLRLERMPPGGLKDLMAVRKLLGLTIPVADLRSVEFPWDVGTMHEAGARRHCEKLPFLSYLRE